jgi:hypothetical protein
MPSFRRATRLTACSVLSLGLTGCLEDFEDGGALLNVFSTHHATPAQGAFPYRGDDSMPRVYDGGGGWEVTLLESYLTIEAVTLIACNGIEYPLNMFWGPCPEDLRSEDLATLTVAGVNARPGDYCGLRVSYGPYQEPVIDEDAEETRHEVPDNVEAIQGATIYLRGGANLEGQDEPISFELATSEMVVVELDLSELEGPGAPMNVARKENFPKELTVTKTYDKFLQAADWSNFDDALIESQLAEILEAETRVVLGQTIDPTMFE